MRIGLTGGIACGKSTVSKMLHDLGARIIDADVIAREVVEPGQEAWQGILQRFGEGMLLDNNQINREKLGALVFTDTQARTDINNIVHPAVRKRMNQLAELAEEEGIPLIVLDIPLLFESGLQHMVDQIIVVYCPAAIQLDRLMKRNGFTKEEALHRIESQWPIEKKKGLGDYVIDNSGNFTETKNQVESLVKKLLKRS